MNAVIRYTACAMILSFSGIAVSQAEPAPPPKIVFGAADPALAPAGTYALDPNHTAVVARVSHIGYSFSVFRFGKTAGSLAWDPKSSASSKLSATVDTNSIM